MREAHLPVTLRWNGESLTDERIAPLEPAEDAAHHEEARQFFEWWYFDAQLGGGYSIVAILHAAAEGIAGGRPAVSLQLYGPAGRERSIRRIYSREDLKVSFGECDVQIGANRARGRPQEYHLHVSEGELEADLAFYGQGGGWKPGEGKVFYGENRYLAWVVPMPRARVEGTVRVGSRVIAARGIGYHDHNWGTMSLARSISRWHWGRLYGDEFTMVYANLVANRRHGSAHTTMLMLASQGNIVLSTGRASVRERESVAFCREANRSYPTGLSIDVPGRLSASLEVKEVIEARDRLRELPLVQRSIVKAFVRRRPAYFRFLSEYSMRIEYEGRNHEVHGETLSEMMVLE